MTTESRPRPLEAQRRSSVALAKEDVLRPLSSALTALLGLAALIASFTLAPFQHPGDALTLSTAAYLLFLLAAALATVGWPYIRARLFPIAFLAFMIPLPAAALEGISIGLQYASAEASDVLMRLTGMPVYRDGLTFKLAGLSVFVAEECSGIRSTLVLFITSLVAGYILLKRPIHRIWIAALVFPLGVLRNALRITTICWLSVNVDLGVIDSPLHHRGGPLFFAISLVPLFVLLWWFRKRELRSKVQEKVSA